MLGDVYVLVRIFLLDREKLLLILLLGYKPLLVSVGKFVILACKCLCVGFFLCFFGFAFGFALFFADVVHRLGVFIERALQIAELIPGQILPELFPFLNLGEHTVLDEFIKIFFFLLDFVRQVLCGFLFLFLGRLFGEFIPADLDLCHKVSIDLRVVV